MTEYGISVRSLYTELSDGTLDSIVQHLKLSYPSLGYRMLDGLLRQRGIRIKQHRLRESLQRVDPNGVVVRWADTIERRRYRVPGPLSLWHVDGNHKLIR